MTTTAPPTTEPGGDTPTTDERPVAPPGAQRSRWWQVTWVKALIASILVLTLVALLTLLATDSSRGDDLDPRSAGPSGTLALAELLRHRGVAVERGGTAGAGATLVVPFSGRLDPAELGRILDDSSSATRIVLLTAGDVPGTPLVEGRLQGISTRAPDCGLGAATTAGDVRIGGRTYRNAGTSCYGGSLVTARRGDTELIVLGSPVLLTNDALDEQGDAALALGLLGGIGVPGEPSHSVVWYQPTLDPQRASPGLLSLLPDGVLWATLQLLVAAVVAALWRGRRLGPVVEEPLPVVVPAAETVEGRARLYAAGRARGAAAAALRAGARARLGAAVSHGGEPDPTGLVTTVAARTGRHPGEVAALLYGSAEPSRTSGSSGSGAGGSATPADIPADDAGLLRLADEIDRLEREVRAR